MQRMLLQGTDNAYFKKLGKRSKNWQRKKNKKIKSQENIVNHNMLF